MKISFFVIQIKEKNEKHIGNMLKYYLKEQALLSKYMHLKNRVKTSARRAKLFWGRKKWIFNDKAANGAKYFN